MKFLIEVDGFETRFPAFKTYTSKREIYLLFNLYNLTMDEEVIFEDAEDRQLYIDQKAGIIALRLPKHKTQFAVQLDRNDRHYHLFSRKKIAICFCYINKSGLQKEDMYSFEA